MLSQDNRQKYFSLLTFCPFNISNPQRALAVLKAYFDGSGKNDARTNILTLGGVVAAEGLWSDFEKGWQRILKANGLNSFHTTDAMALWGEFKNWSRPKVEILIQELMSELGKWYPRQLHIKSCTIDLGDYRKLKRLNPKLRIPEAICVEFCCLSPWPPDEIIPRGEFAEIVLYFDIGESFLKNIDRVWRKARKRNEPGWPRQVQAILPVPAEKTPALQAADLVAWTVSAYYRDVKRANAFHSLLPMFGMHQFYDYRKIEKDYPNG